ncbi:MAG: oligosaccharide flippase family protein [Anaerolineae bacterium]
MYFQLSKRLAYHPVTQNAASLLVISAANYILPLILVPYLARILQPAGWGEVLFAQSYAILLAIIVEYGFLFSATRDVARQTESPGALATTVNAVNGAKGLLSLAATAIAVVSWAVIPQFQHSPSYLVFAWFTAISQGLYPMWYFQGVLRMRRLALLSTIARALATALTFPLVHSPADGWLVLALQAVATGVATAIAIYWMYKDVPFRCPLTRDVLQALDRGKYMFTVSLAAGVYGLASNFFVGLLTNPVQVGLYGGAERINRIMTNLFAIFGQALYPYISQTVHIAPRRFIRIIRVLFLCSSIMGIALTVITVVAAPWLVKSILGSGFEPAVFVLQIMALQITLTSISRILGILWMLPLGMDRSFNYIVLTACIVNLGLTVLLVPAWQALGMAIAFVLTETFVTGALAWFLQHSGYAFWSRNNKLLREDGAKSLQGLS